MRQYGTIELVILISKCISRVWRACLPIAQSTQRLLEVIHIIVSDVFKCLFLENANK